MDQPAHWSPWPSVPVGKHTCTHTCAHPPPSHPPHTHKHTHVLKVTSLYPPTFYKCDRVKSRQAYSTVVTSAWCLWVFHSMPLFSTLPDSFVMTSRGCFNKIYIINIKWRYSMIYRACVLEQYQILTATTTLPNISSWPWWFYPEVTSRRGCVTNMLEKTAGSSLMSPVNRKELQSFCWSFRGSDATKWLCWCDNDIEIIPTLAFRIVQWRQLFSWSKSRLNSSVPK